MSQLNPAGFDDQGELDPLLAFDSEVSALESPAKPVNVASPPAPPAGEDMAPLRQRLEQSERSLERAQLEIASLKSDLATLVNTIDDIKKRLSRRPEVVATPPVAPLAYKTGIGRPAALVILLLALGVAIWRAASVVLVGIPEPAPIDSESLMPLNAPAPVSEIARPTIALPAAATTPAPVARSVRQNVEREPVARAAYVGTLSIDSAPAGEVFIDRQVAGRTPMRAEQIRAGSHLIWIERDGYHRWTRVVAVAADRVTRVWADLEPLSR